MNRTTNTSGEGAPEEIQGQTASDSEQEIVHIQKTSGDTATRWWIPTSVVSSVGNHYLSTTYAATIRLNGTHEEDGVGRSTTVGNVANPDTTTHRHKPTRSRFRNDKHTRQDRHRREREGAVV